MEGKAAETMFTTTAGVFYTPVAFEEFAGAVLKAQEQGGMIAVQLTGGERTIVNAAAIGQVLEGKAAGAKHRIGFR